VLHAHVEDLVVFVPAWSGYDGYQIPADQACARLSRCQPSARRIPPNRALLSGDPPQPHSPRL